MRAAYYTVMLLLQITSFTGAKTYAIDLELFTEHGNAANDLGIMCAEVFYHFAREVWHMPPSPISSDFSTITAETKRNIAG